MPEAPTGTVTLVFTDIEGSTQLWERFGDGIKSTLSLHNQILRDAIEEFSGYEVQTAGDAFLLAFAEAGDAVRYCLETQRRLHDADWSADLLSDDAVSDFVGVHEDGSFRGVRVRMGVHTGEPFVRKDPTTGRWDYGGQMCNRAARIGGAPHGGQLVISQATYEAAGERFGGDEVVLVDLGEHALRGLERREHLWQVLPKRLAHRRFPRIKTPNLKKTNLPNRLDSFFGREPEIAELKQRIADGQRLITLLGAAGTGKTRLTQRLGGTQLADFPGGVWFCDLTEVRSKEGILSAMGAALEVPLTGKDPEAQLADAILGRGRVLVILDNFEQVVDHGAETVGRWLQRSPEAVFLVTSRTLLRIAGEEVLYLDPLPVAEAVQLFYERARAVQPGVVRTAENEPVVTEIVERLDCMSLAIELAAARVRMLSPEKILARLSQRFKLLRGQRRDQSGRQATLRGAIDWSWELLKSHEQSALAQLSVFHGGCTLEAAEAVVDLAAFDKDPWVMDVVEALVDHSLLRRVEPYPGHVRYQMLESIREYAAEKLGQAAESTGLRHAEHFATFGDEAWIEALDTPGGIERRRDLALELQNLSAGVDGGLAAGDAEAAAGCAFAASEVLRLHGPFSDGIALLKRVSERPVGRRTQGRLLLMAGWLLHAAGHVAESLEHYDQALAIAREGGNRRGEGIILGYLANLHGEQGRIPEALKHYDQALAILRDVGDRRAEGSALGNLANLHQHHGHMPEALEHYHQALAIHREVGNRRGEGIMLGNLANLHRQHGRIPEALEHYSQALAIARDVGNRRDEGLALGNLAGLHQTQGRLTEALEHSQQALAIAREMGDRRGEGMVLGNLGELLFGRGDLPAAETHLLRAIVICDETLPYAAGAFRGSLALIRSQQGAFDEARALLEQGESQIRGVHKLELGKLLCKKARVEHLAGDPATAAAALAEAESIAVELAVSPDSELSDVVAEARAALDS